MIPMFLNCELSFKQADLFVDILNNLKISINSIFRWSHDGKFFARLAPDTLSVYETEVNLFISKH